MTKHKVVLWRICMKTKREREGRRKKKTFMYIKHACMSPYWKVATDTHQTPLRKVTIGNQKKSCTPPKHNNFHHILVCIIHTSIFLSLLVNPVHVII